MKGILEFNLPEENHEFKLHHEAMSWAYAWRELDEHLRAIIKWTSPETMTDDERKAYETVRADIRTILDNRDLSLESL